MPLVSPEVAVSTDTVTMTAIGQLKPLKPAAFHVKSFTVAATVGNTGTVKLAYGAGSARLMPLPQTFPYIPGQVYDLNKFIVEAIDHAGDSVVVISQR